MKKLVIDIETVGIPWEEHDTYVREYLIKGMSEAEAEEQKRRARCRRSRVASWPSVSSTSMPAAPARCTRCPGQTDLRVEKRRTANAHLRQREADPREILGLLRERRPLHLLQRPSVRRTVS